MGCKNKKITVIIPENNQNIINKNFVKTFFFANALWFTNKPAKKEFIQKYSQININFVI